MSDRTDKHSYKVPALIAVGLHVLILIVLVVKFDWFKDEEIIAGGPPGPIINATAVESKQVEKQLNKLAAAKKREESKERQKQEEAKKELERLEDKREKAEAEAKAAEAKAEAEKREAETETQKREELKKQREEAESQAQAAEAKARETEKRLEEQKRKEVAEQKLREEEKQRKLATEKKKKEEAERKKKEEEAKKKAEVEKKKKAEAARKKAEREALDQEMAQELEAEAGEVAEARAAAAMNRAGQYAGQIEAHVKRFLTGIPPEYCGLVQVRVQLGADGAVQALGQCSGDAAICTRVIAALQKANPLPPPPDGDVLDLVNKSPFEFDPNNCGG